MPNIVIAGAQWGDEGKGKIVDLLTERVQVVARYNGGHNAGHTILLGKRKFVLHVIPSGILHPGILCVMGNGMVVDPWAFEAELAELAGQGIEVGDNLLVSERAHLILPHHRALEGLSEDLRGARKIGTTQRGIGPAYEDKAGRRGITMGDLLRPAALPAKLEEARRHFEQVFRGAGRTADVAWDKLHEDLADFGERLRPRIGDVSLALHRHLAAGYSILFEGAQATLLDLDHGTYPFVTSSSAVAAGAATGLGIPPTRIDGVLGIAKAYSTRVGTGPFPTEMTGEIEQAIRERGREFGATTGRPRRCGWFDAVAVRYAVRVNGFDAIALTKLDVLDGLAEIPVCTAYLLDGWICEEVPAEVAALGRVQPVYEVHEGWRQPTGGARTLADLPKPARAYLDRLEALSGAPVRYVSVGTRRDQIIEV